MIVSSCPRCAEAFRVPTTGLPEDAYAECPWCRETFPIAEVLHRLPPMLQVMSADGEPLETNEWSQLGQQGDFAGGVTAGFAADRSPSVRPQDDGGAATTVSDLSPDEFEHEHKTVAEDTVAETLEDAIDGSDTRSASQFDLEDPHDTWEGHQAAERSSTPAPMRVTPAPARHRKSSGSPIRTMISIVLGGLAAGPLAVLILWVLTLFGVNVDLGFWPLDGSSAVVGTNTVAAEPAELPDVRSGPPSLTPTEEGSLSRDDDFDFSSGSDAFDPVSEDAGGDEIDVFADPADAAASEFRASFGEGDELDNASESSADAAEMTEVLPESPDIEFPESESSGVEMSADDETVAEPTASSGPESGTPGDPFAGDDPFAIGSDPIAGDDPFVVDTDPFSVDAEPTEQADSPDVASSGDQRPGLDQTSAMNGEASGVSGDAADEPGLRVNEASDAETVVEPNSDSKIAADPEDAGGPNRDAEPDLNVEAETENVTRQESDAEPASAARSAPPESVDPTPNAVDQAVASALSQLDALEAIESEVDDVLKIPRRDAYLAIAQVGVVANPSSRGTSELLDRIRKSKHVKVLTGAAKDWLDLPKGRRPNQGVLLVGAPRLDEKPASLLLSTGTSIRLSDDSVSLPDAERVIGLGEIVESDPEPVIKINVAEPL